MADSIFLAKFLGIFFTVWSIGIIINQKRIKEAVDEIVQSKSMQLMAAFLPLIIGSLLVPLHNKWTADWTVMITIMAWLFLLGGIFRAIFTPAWVKLVIKMKAKMNFTIFGVISLGIGLVLLYFGFRGSWA